MQIKEIMTANPACCTASDTLRDVARLMVEKNCGAIPIIQDQKSRKPIGILTDRDITCRAVANGKNPLDLTARDLMTQPVLTLTPETSVEECCRLMEANQIRRMPVVDASGGCCGIVAQADVARMASEREIAELVKDVSMAARAKGA
jgi:CBS domain-containing protein